MKAPCKKCGEKFERKSARHYICDNCSKQSAKTKPSNVGKKKIVRRYK